LEVVSMHLCNSMRLCQELTPFIPTQVGIDFWVMNLVVSESVISLEKF
jgi:hypothetical protein